MGGIPLSRSPTIAAIIARLTALEAGDGGSGAGTSPTITVGLVTTGAPGSVASVTNTGTASAAVFNFTIPRGDTGSPGGGGGGGITVLTGDVTASGSGSVETTIASRAVGLTKQADVATASVFYRKSAGTGSPQVQALSTLKADLDLSGTNSGDQSLDLGINTQEGPGNYTLALSDNRGLIRMASGTPNQVIIPANASVAFPVGAQVVVKQIGMGKTTIVISAGVSITDANRSIPSQYGSVTLVKVATDTWDILGATVA